MTKPKPICKLDPIGLKAFEGALDALAEFGDSRYLGVCLAEGYAWQVQLEQDLFDEWRRLGSPGMSLGGKTGRSKVAHPLLEMISEAGRTASEFASLLGLTPQARKKLGARVGRPQERVPPKLRPVSP